MSEKFTVVITYQYEFVKDFPDAIKREIIQNAKTHQIPMPPYISGARNLKQTVVSVSATIKETPESADEEDASEGAQADI